MNAEPETVRLYWRTAAAGCLTPLLIGMALFMLYWGLDPGAVGPDDMDGRGGGFLRMAATMSAGGVGWGFLALSACAAWVAAQMSWRFAEHVALSAGPAGLRMHGMFGRGVRWELVEELRIEARGKQTGIALTFSVPQPGFFSPVRSRHHWTAGVDLDGGAGEAFETAAARWRGDSAAPR